MKKILMFVMEKVLMSENMPKPFTLPIPTHFQYAPSFLGTYLHLFICVSFSHCIIVLTDGPVTHSAFKLNSTCTNFKYGIIISIECFGYNQRHK